MRKSFSIFSTKRGCCKMRLESHFVWATPCAKHEKSRTAKSPKHAHHYKLNSSQIIPNPLIYFLDVVISRSWSAHILHFPSRHLRGHPSCLKGPSWWQRTRMINVVTLDNDEHKCSKGCIGDMHLWHGCVEAIGNCTSLGAGMLWGFMCCIFSASAMLRLESRGTGTASGRDHDVLPRTRSG